MEFVKRYKYITFPDDIEIEHFISKRKQRMVRSTRRISAKTARKVKAKLEKEGHFLSLGTVVKILFEFAPQIQ